MKKVGKKIWIGILSGLTLLMGACHFHRGHPALYGPPPPELYGPPTPELEADTLPSQELEEEL